MEFTVKTVRAPARWALLLLALLTLAACADKKSEEGSTQPPSREQPAEPPASEPATPPAESKAQPPQTAPGSAPAKPDTGRGRAAEEPGRAVPPPAPPSETTKPAPPPPQEAKPAPKEEPKPGPKETAKPTPAEESKPAPPTQSAPQKPPTTGSKKPIAKDVVVLTASKLGGVRLQHKLHAERAGNTCTSCHHASKPEKPATAPQQACSACHAKVATPPMKTKLQAAFHDPKAQSGTCIDCHKTENAKGKKAPLKCTECHRKEIS